MKIAFCLVGIVGAANHKNGIGVPVDYRIGHHFHQKHIFNPNNEHDIDVFIHSWSTEFETPLVDLYNPKKYIFEKQIDFLQDDIRNNCIISRWYSTAMSVRLKTAYEQQNNFKYDFVMLYRFDHIFQKDLIFLEFNPNNFYVSHRDDCTKSFCKCVGNKRFYDAWFFSNSNYINTFSALYDSWLYYNLKDPHMETVRHLHETGLISKVKHVFYEKKDHFTVRSRIKNCHLTDNKLEIDKLEFFDKHNLKRHKWVGENHEL